MLKTNTVAKRYAQALINIASKKNSVDIVGDNIREMGSLYEGHKRLAEFLNHPMISFREKIDVLIKMTGYNIDDIVMKFAHLIIDKGRINYLPEIVKSYQFLQDSLNGIVRAKVVAAFSLDGRIQHDLQDKLKSMTGREVILNIENNPRLLGGLTIQIGDTVFDGSINGRLKLLREKLSASVRN